MNTFYCNAYGKVETTQEFPLNGHVSITDMSSEFLRVLMYIARKKSEGGLGITLLNGKVYEVKSINLVIN